MVEADRKRFIAVLTWLCRKYPVDGKPRALPLGEDLVDYFAALRDVPIEDIEGGGRWHYGHSEFYPDRPAALRRSCEGWRAENPRPPIATMTVRREQTIEERCDSDKFEQFMSTLAEMSRDKFGESCRDNYGRARTTACDQRSRLLEQKKQLAVMAGSEQ